MSPTITTARTAIKALGYNTRQVSIRQDHGSLRFTVRDPAVKLAAIYAIAQRAERIHRCEITGEILCGGNTFAEVCLAANVAEVIKAPLRAIIADDGARATYDLDAVPGLAGVRVYQEDPWTWTSTGAQVYLRSATALEAAFTAWWHVHVVQPQTTL